MFSLEGNLARRDEQIFRSFRFNKLIFFVSGRAEKPLEASRKNG